MIHVNHPSSDPNRVAFASHIGHAFAGKSLLDFLGTRFTYFSKDDWTQRLREGEVVLNNQSATGQELLKNGDEVKYFALRATEPWAPKTVPILFEDEDLLIVNKPPHLPVHPTGRYLHHTLIHVLKKQRPRQLLVLAHRLDRETSGVCVLTKTHLAKEKMYWSFFNQENDKTYWALVWGEPNPKSGTIDAPIGNVGPQSPSRIRIKQIIRGADSKTAKTKFHTLGTQWIRSPHWAPPPWAGLNSAIEKQFGHAASEHRGPWPISLVEAKPLTGRTNQIRVHLAHVGCGLVGDKMYDPDERVFLDTIGGNKHVNSSPYADIQDTINRRLILDSHALHARALEFRHPRTGKKLTVTAPEPKSWRPFLPAQFR